MAKNNYGGILVVAAIVLVAYLVIANPFAKEPVPPVSPGDPGVCDIDDVSFYAKMTRMGKAGTTVADNYYVITDNLGSTGYASAATVPTNYAMKIMFGENSTTYYTMVKDISTECSNPMYESVQLAYYEPSLTTYAENENGQINTASVAQAMGADDDFDVTVTMKASSDAYFGNPYSECRNVAVVEYDKTYIKNVEGDEAATVPGCHAFKNATYDGREAFFIPKSGDGESVTFNVLIESTSTQPTGVADPWITFYDCDVDKDEDTLEVIEGVEDEDNNAIALAAQTLEVHLS